MSSVTWQWKELETYGRSETFSTMPYRLRNCSICRPQRLSAGVQSARSDEDTLFELKGAAMRAGYVPMAAVRAVAQHSIVPAIAAGRSALRDILLTMESDTAIAAVAGFYVDFNFIYKHMILLNR